MVSFFEYFISCFHYESFFFYFINMIYAGIMKTWKQLINNRKAHPPHGCAHTWGVE